MTTFSQPARGRHGVIITETKTREVRHSQIVPQVLLFNVGPINFKSVRNLSETVRNLCLHCLFLTLLYRGCLIPAAFSMKFLIASPALDRGFRDGFASLWFPSL